MAWDSSQGIHTVVTEKSRESGLETITRTEKSRGDSQFIQTILKCVATRCRIFGLYAPPIPQLNNIFDLEKK
jgi:hypothetical protein